MTRYLLDTNIISNVTRPAPNEALMAWMVDQADDDLFIASLTIAEIRRGVLEKSAGRKRAQVDAWFSGPEGPQALFAGRILAFDAHAALIWARLMAECTASGRPRSALDMIIASVAQRMTAFSSPTMKGTSSGWRSSTRCGLKFCVSRRQSG